VQLDVVATLALVKMDVEVTVSVGQDNSAAMTGDLMSVSNLEDEKICTMELRLLFK